MNPPNKLLLFVVPSNNLSPSAVKHSFAHIDCPACEETRALSMHDPDKLKLLPFEEAAEIWLETRRPYMKPNPFYLLGQHVKRLDTFFGKLMVQKIHIGHLREYQQARLNNTGNIFPKKAGASIIKHEMVALAGVLKRAGEWDKIKPHYEALKTPAPKSPKVLSDSEEMMVFTIAAQNADWSLAYWVASITCNTGASGTELRNIQFKDLFLDARVPFFMINPATAKTDSRGRPVVLNATAMKQMQRCIDRARSLGSALPSHYLFPRRRHRGAWDATKPASESWLRRSFAELREAVGIPWLTPHCFRHQHITLRIESGDPIELVAKDVGHTATAMTRYYTHQRRERQLVSVNAIDPSVRFGPQSQGAEKINRILQK